MQSRDIVGEPFGQTADGTRATLYRLANEHMRVAITDYAGRIVSIETADRDGRWDHVVLGFDSAEGYERALDAAFGALLGRNANRIGGGRFTLDGAVYPLSQNEGDTTLHGGEGGFDKVFWRVIEAGGDRVSLGLTSPDGDQGFPGELTVTATYRLAGDTLWLDFTAETAKATPVSLSAHPYFNLGGPACPDILGDHVQIAAQYFLPTDAKQIPTGEIRPVDGSEFDFRDALPIGARIRRPNPQLLIGKGYDHCFVLGGAVAGEPRFAASAWNPQTGRRLEILTTQPGLQFYSGNMLDGSIAGRGGIYRQSAGLAFEPQGFPDAVNRPEFPSTILHPGETYRQRIGYRLTTR